MSILKPSRTLQIPYRVTHGYGEYIAFEYEDEKAKDLSYEQYIIIYDIFREYNASSNSLSEEDLLKKIHAFNPNIYIAFIPYTLYTLIYLHRCIEEDLLNKSICHLSSISEDTGNTAEQIQTYKIARKCWHIYVRSKYKKNFETLIRIIKIKRKNEQIKNLAYRLNNFIVEFFNPEKIGFTYCQLHKFMQEEIDFFKKHHAQFSKLFFSGAFESYCGQSGPTVYFALEKFSGRIPGVPLGIRDENAKILFNAMALECSTLSNNAIVLYRGSQKDQDGPKLFYRPNSLSFSTTPFTGAMFDPSATAFHYMRMEKNDAYALVIPKDRAHIFAIPEEHMLCQLYGIGEFFHARTKIWKRENGSNNTTGGVCYSTSEQHFEEIEQKLKCDLSEREICEQFDEYKRKAIDLKSDIII